MSAPVGLFQIANLKAAPPVVLRPILLPVQWGAPPEMRVAPPPGDTQSNAPILTVAPSAPGIYQGKDGKAYVVPAVRIAYRANLPRTRDIAFTTDKNGTNLVVTLELVLPPGADASATLLGLDAYVVRIDPGDGTAAYEFPLVTALPADGRRPEVVGRLQARGPIDPTAGFKLLSEKPAHLYVTGRAAYRYAVRHVTHPDPPDPPPVIPPYHRGWPVIQPLEVTALDREIAQRPLAEMPIAERAKLEMPISESVLAQLDVNRLAWTETIESASVDALLTNSENAQFAPQVRDNKPIYAAILGTDAGATAIWSRETGKGYSAPSASPNEYYVLPDAFRLAIDPATGLPSMNVFVISTPPAAPGASTQYTVRVRFGIAPLLDGARLEGMRAAIRGANDIPYATLTIGGYSSATFVPSAVFAGLPGLGTVSGSAQAGAAQNIDAASGFELVMDCSLEAYTLLTKLLVSPDGLQGNVQFSLVTARDDAVPPNETTLLASVPVALSLTGAAAVTPPTTLVATPPTLPAPPVATAPAANPATPRGNGASDPNATSLTLSVGNPLAVPLKIDGIFPTLLEGDAELGVTSAAHPLAPQVASLELKANETLSVVAQSADGKPLPATPTALAVTYGTMIPTFEPTALLAHYHELAAASGISATAHFECYLLKHPDRIPPALAGLIAMQVEVQRGAGPVVALPLTLDAPEKDVRIPYSFDDLLAGLSLDEPTFKYRAKSIFTDRSGAFSDFIDNTGRDVLVTPA